MRAIFTSESDNKLVTFVEINFGKFIYRISEKNFRLENEWLEELGDSINFEIGLEKNNFFDVTYSNNIEIKLKRFNTSSFLTLFHSGLFPNYDKPNPLNAIVKIGIGYVNLSSENEIIWLFTGKIVEYKYNFVEMIFSVSNIYNLSSVTIPSQKITRDKFPNAPELNLDTPIPIHIGNLDTTSVSENYNSILEPIDYLGVAYLININETGLEFVFSYYDKVNFKNTLLFWDRYYNQSMNLIFIKDNNKNLIGVRAQSNTFNVYGYNFRFIKLNFENFYYWLAKLLPVEIGTWNNIATNVDYYNITDEFINTYGTLSKPDNNRISFIFEVPKISKAIRDLAEEKLILYCEVNTPSDIAVVVFSRDGSQYLWDYGTITINQVNQKIKLEFNIHDIIAHYNEFQVVINLTTGDTLKLYEVFVNLGLYYAYIEKIIDNVIPMNMIYKLLKFQGIPLIVGVKR
jgi:hypothetical protein